MVVFTNQARLHIGSRARFDCCDVLFYFQHSVPDADVGLYILRRIRQNFYFFAQCCHEYPQRSYVVIPTASPYLLSDKGMSQYFSDV